ncbi:Alpha/Beta hydrolase protein [Ilyonectria sp. MPI-CAGE-AT-0026]|nr:Alpha/Beta hydrolase protein [Ilyonectria sp. MPI-CAGE-AT-0026]
MECAIRHGTVAFSHQSIPNHIQAKTWYRIIGSLDSGIRPLVVLHGGPGYTHAYLKPAFDLFSKKTSTPVIYYDQLGNGHSTHLREKRLDESFWTADLFVEELNNLLQNLHVDQDFNLYGHSWGAMLAVKYAAHYQPRGLHKLILGSGPASLALWKEAARNFIPLLPVEQQEILRSHRIDHPLYGKALMALNEATTLMKEPYPVELQESLYWLEKDDTVVITTNGPSDLVDAGSLESIDVTPDCVHIHIPVLIISGSQDGATAETIQPLYDSISDVKWIVMQEGSHMVHLQDPSQYIDHIADF